jgi:hypothetical protein
MSHMAEYTCCSSVAFERPNENTFTLHLHTSSFCPCGVLSPQLSQTTVFGMGHYMFIQIVTGSTESSGLDVVTMTAHGECGHVGRRDSTTLGLTFSESIPDPYTTALRLSMIQSVVLCPGPRAMQMQCLCVQSAYCAPLPLLASSSHHWLPPTPQRRQYRSHLQLGLQANPQAPTTQAVAEQQSP